MSWEALGSRQSGLVGHRGVQTDPHVPGTQRPASGSSLLWSWGGEEAESRLSITLFLMLQRAHVKLISLENE